MIDFIQKLERFQNNVAAQKHVDGKQLAINFFFPLLRSFAESTAEQFAEQSLAIAELESMITAPDSLEAARDLIVFLAGLLDETMVTAGFYQVTPQGLKDTEKAPPELRAKYLQAGEQINDVIALIEDDLTRDEDDEGEDTEGEEQPDHHADEPKTPDAVLAPASAADGVLSASTKQVPVRAPILAVVASTRVDEGNLAAGAAAASDAGPIADAVADTVAGAVEAEKAGVQHGA